MHRPSRNLLRLLLLPPLAGLAVIATLAKSSPLTSVIEGAGNPTIALSPVVNLGNGLVPIDGASMPGSDKLFVATFAADSASVRVVDPVARTVGTFLSFSDTSVPVTGQGLQGITFSPDFADPSKPGYRKFYTFQAESGPGGANIMFTHPEVANPGTVGVLREWTANEAGTTIDTSIPSRVVFNYGTPGGHMGGGLKFGPDGYLYLATGDGGGNGNGGSTTNSGDGFTGRNPSGSSNDVPGISNGQDFTNVLGKVVRIDPYITEANGSPRELPAGAIAKSFDGQTRYFIPADNPFLGNPQNVFFTPIGPATSHSPEPPLEELFALGFRNPWKLSFDSAATPGDLPFVADVGSHVREEIDLVAPGANYGWPYREGDIESGAASGRPLTNGNVPYLTQTGPGAFADYDLDPTLSDPTQMALPMARLGTRSISGGQFWDRPSQDYFGDGIYGDEWGDTNSVTGGFVYRGSTIPELQGMYVFGGYEYAERANSTDYSPQSQGGRLFYFDPDEAAAYKTVREFNYLSGFGIDTNAGGNLLGIAEGADGELFALFANGDVRQIVGVKPGDFNGDGLVNIADYTVWRDNLGADESVLALGSSDDSTEIVDSGDYATWKETFQQMITAETNLSHTAQVPEPTPVTAALLGFVLVSLLRNARRPRGD